MKFSTSTLLSVMAIAAPITSAFVSNTAFSRPLVKSVITNSESVFTHPGNCVCAPCLSNTLLSMSDVVEAEVPAEVEALDGVDSEEEAHNVERPARASGTSKHKNKKKGTPLSELEVGSMVEGTVKTITSYGAFLDIGASTDALLHVSRLSDDFVSNVEDIVTAGQVVSVRIVNIDTEKKQVAVSMRSEEAEARAASGGGGRGKDRPRRSGGDRAAQREAMKALVDNGFDTDLFVEGEVQSTLDFGAFVRFATKDFGEGLEGEIDGLVHISALAPRRVNTVNDICKPGDKVQIRIKSIDAQSGKVALSMVSAADEPKPRENRGRRGKAQFTEEEMGAKDWKEQLDTFQEDKPLFKNMPIIEDKRK